MVPANPLATTLVVVVTSPPDSLEMKSKVAKTSRGGSNQSTSQSFIDAYLARRKREEINKLMEMLEGCLDSLDVTAHAHGAGNSSQRCNSSHSSSSTGSNTNAPQKPARQKRALDRDSFDESDPGRDGNDQDKRGGKRSRVSTSPALKLACPFFKRDPTKYKDRQACTGPGYTSISRLKLVAYSDERMNCPLANEDSGSISTELTGSRTTNATGVAKSSQAVTSLRSINAQMSHVKFPKTSPRTVSPSRNTSSCVKNQ